MTSLNANLPVSAIAAVARNGVIGRDNQLPWRIPEDLKYFKRMTLGKPYIMGRKSFDSLGKPLPGRFNIVVSRSEGLSATGDLVFVRTIEDALKAARENAAQTSASEIIIGGGAQIYDLAMPFTTRLYLTRIDRDYDGQTFFPAIEEKQWVVTAEDRHDGDPPFTFQVLDRIV